MPVKATITLDSGSFLPKSDSFCRIGYFECEPHASDLQIRVDGNVPPGLPDPLKLGKECVIEVCHLDTRGNVKMDGVRLSAAFGSALLRLRDLYAAHVPVKPENFDCVICLFSGELTPVDIRHRHFREHRRQPDGSYAPVPGGQQKHAGKPIMHDFRVTYSLADGEWIALRRDGVTFWSSENLNVANDIDIKVLCDRSTTTKFFGDSFASPQSVYWLPNPDPPPMCPAPPCPDAP